MLIVACGSERAPVVVPSAPVADAAAVEAAVADVAVETAAPVIAADVDADTEPLPTNVPMTLGPPIAKALLERLAREAAAIPNGQLRKSPPRDAERDRAIKAQFGDRCRLERTCGPLWGIDCQAAVDGPYYYVRPRADGWIRITVCGGACMGGRCTNCPPKNEGWTCETY